MQSLVADVNATRWWIGRWYTTAVMRASRDSRWSLSSISWSANASPWPPDCNYFSFCAKSLRSCITSAVHGCSDVIELSIGATATPPCWRYAECDQTASENMEVLMSWLFADHVFLTAIIPNNSLQAYAGLRYFCDMPTTWRRDYCRPNVVTVY